MSWVSGGGGYDHDGHAIIPHKQKGTTFFEGLADSLFGNRKKQPTRPAQMGRAYSQQMGGMPQQQIQYIPANEGVQYITSDLPQEIIQQPSTQYVTVNQPAQTQYVTMEQPTTQYVTVNQPVQTQTQYVTMEQPVQQMIEQPMETQYVIQEPVQQQIIQQPVETQYVIQEPVQQRVIQQPVETQYVIQEPVQQRVIQQPVETQYVIQEPVQRQIIQQPVETQYMIQEPVQQTLVQQPMETQYIMQPQPMQQTIVQQVEQPVQQIVQMQQSAPMLQMQPAPMATQNLQLGGVVTGLSPLSYATGVSNISQTKFSQPNFDTGSYTPGVEMQMSPNGQLVVVAIDSGTSAWDSALKVGDRVLSIDGEAVSSLPKAKRLLSGDEGTLCTVSTDDGDFSVLRDKAGSKQLNGSFSSSTITTGIPGGLGGSPLRAPGGNIEAGAPGTLMDPQICAMYGVPVGSRWGSSMGGGREPAGGLGSMYGTLDDEQLGTQI